MHGLDLKGGEENIFFRSPFLELSVFTGKVACVPNLESDDPADKYDHYAPFTPGDLFQNGRTKYVPNIPNIGSIIFVFQF